MPLQDRSRARLERILDTAAELFVVNGYDATTTELIAAHAGTSIGSIYQFFPNKRAVFDALAARHLSEVAGLFERFALAEAAPWRELIERTVDAFAAYHRQNMGFRAILLNWKLSPEFIEAGELLDREFARRAEAMFEARAPAISKERLRAASTLAVEVVSAALVTSVRMNDSEATAIFEETKTLLVRYLSPYLEPKSKKKKKKRRKN